MIALEVHVPFANFRKSFARSFAESYTIPPPATLYGMLLSLVGERWRRTHTGARLALGMRQLPKVVTVLKKLSRYKYGVATKQEKLGNAPDYMEVVCGLDLILCLDSSNDAGKPSLEERLALALDHPERIERSGVLCLGLSDDMVDSVRRLSLQRRDLPGKWLVCDASGPFELPVWVDHVGSINTRWRRFRLMDAEDPSPPKDAWIEITSP
jgi:CRISPR-associated protein Cas5t